LAYRNGYRPRTWDTRVGMLELAILIKRRAHVVRIFPTRGTLLLRFVGAILTEQDDEGPWPTDATSARSRYSRSSSRSRRVPSGSRRGGCMTTRDGHRARDSRATRVAGTHSSPETFSIVTQLNHVQQPEARAGRCLTRGATGGVGAQIQRGSQHTRRSRVNECVRSWMRRH
jgi:hypothetical protein